MKPDQLPVRCSVGGEGGSTTCHAVVPRLPEGVSTVSSQLRKGAWLPRSFTLSTNNYLSRRNYGEVGSTTCHVEVRQLPDEGGSALRKLFINELDLLVDHLPGKPIDGHMDPVMCFPFHDETGKTTGVGRIAPALRDYIDQ